MIFHSFLYVYQRVTWGINTQKWTKKRRWLHLHPLLSPVSLDHSQDFGEALQGRLARCASSHMEN